MNPSKRIQAHEGSKATERKAPARAIAGSKTAMSKGGAMRAAGKVTKASRHHGAKMVTTPGLKGANNC